MTDQVTKIDRAEAVFFGQARQRNLAKRLKKYKFLFVLLFPALAYFIVFKYAPLYGILIAFKNYKFTDGILGSEWVGLKHFIKMFSGETFLQVFRNTLVISLGKLAFGFPAPIIFAILLNEIRKSRFKKTVQTISYLPHFVSWVVLAGVIMEFLSFRGPVNQLVVALGGKPQVFLTNPALFVPMLVVTDSWHVVGWSSIIYLAAISNIDPQLYEAADMDGAGRISQIIHITLPSLLPVISILLLLRIGRLLNAGFDQVFNLYNPLVYSVADIIDTYTYRVGLVQMDFSYSTAVGMFKNVLGLTLMLTVNSTINRVKEYGIW